MPTAAPLRARDLTVVAWPAHRPRRRRPRRRARAPHRRRRAQRRRQVDAAAGARRAACRSSGARVERTPPTATVGYLPAGAVAVGDETVTGVPRPPHRRRRGDGRAGRGHGRRWPPGADGADDRYADALDRWLALGGADLDARVGQVWADLGLVGAAARPADGVAVGRRGGAGRRWPRCCWPASTCSCSTSRRTTSTSTASTGSSGGSPALPAAVVLVSHDRTFLARTVTDVVELDEFTHRATHFGGGWQAYLDEREAARRAAWERFEEYDTKRKGAGRAGPARAGVGDAGPVEGARSPTSRTRTSGPSRSTRPSSSPGGRPAPSGRSSGSTSSTSRASRGSCG